MSEKLTADNITDEQVCEWWTISVAQMEASGWRITARGEWTHDYFGPKGGSGLAYGFRTAQMLEGFARARCAEILNARGDQ